jgi:hypothetical protein
MHPIAQILATIACGLIIGSTITLKLWAAPPQMLVLLSLWRLLIA